ncbi:MAG TPA: class I SAM-dependent methyltransferase [Chitinophagaceae bacterium]|nr:class I SAM-dependent methyltransferase [Chitinophagaceae bacterium]
MSVIIHHTSCPCCNSEKINEVLVAKDYTVSKEDFSIWECVNCTVRFTQNIPDAASIGPYYQSSAYVSHTDTKEGLVNQLYHIVRNFTLKTKRDLLQQQTGLQQGHLLDIGAGTGAFAQTMKEAGWQITGLEPDASARTIAKQKFGLLLQMPNKLYTLPQAQFDAITMWHVLEHVHDSHSYLEQFNVVLKPQGKIFIAVPNYTSGDASSYKKHWAAYDVPRHLYHFSPKSIDILAASKGFTVKAYKPMWFDSFYVSMLSEQCKNGSGNLVMAFLNGLLSNLQALFNVKKCSSVIYVLSKK